GTAVPVGPQMHCVIPAVPHWWTLLSSMFMHGGWFHLITNMWFFWVFGNNIEDSMGHGRFVVFYLLCGLAAAATQVLISPNSAVPMVGASGAISGVMGAYVLLYPRVRVHTLIFLGFFVTTVTLPAYVILGYWFLLQWAHVGGFVAGMLLIKVFANPEFLERRRAAPVIVPRGV
ncbi:MAG: rhomboid family intramembrane serine protease, partial [Gemmatimonadetes bacterium]